MESCEERDSRTKRPAGVMPGWPFCRLAAVAGPPNTLSDRLLRYKPAMTEVSAMSNPTSEEIGLRILAVKAPFWTAWPTGEIASIYAQLAASDASCTPGAVYGAAGGNGPP